MKKSKFNNLVFISLIILQIATVANVYGLYLNFNLQLFVNLLAIVLEVMYYAYGFKKNAFLYFRGFMAFIALKEALALINMAIYETVPVSAIALVLACYTCAIILAVAKDLGKKTSLSLGGIIVAISVICLIFAIILTPPHFMGGNQNGTYLFIYNGTRVLLSLELLVMIMAKYVDKQIRKTK